MRPWDLKRLGYKADKDDKKPVPPKHVPRHMNFIIGGVSGAIAICLVQPADLLKTRIQLMGQEAHKISTLQAARQIVKNEGILAFYTGVSAAVFRQLTYGTGRLGVFNGLFDTYRGLYNAEPTFIMKLLFGVTGGAFGGIVGNPAEVALIRMTADGRLPPEKKRNYRHVFHALAKTARDEGVLALWKGTTATVTRAMIVNAAELGSYAQARESLQYFPSLGTNILLHFCASMVAGIVTTFTSLPVDIVKTRVQMESKGMSQIATFLNIVKYEGVTSLWHGFLPTYMKLGPHAVFTFIILEQLNLLYLRMQDKNTVAAKKGP